MQEWIIAMLVLSILLILRDMAKTVLKGRKSRKEEPFPLGGEHPQKEKVERYAASFQKLADTFYGMPYKKEYLSSAQVENVIRETGQGRGSARRSPQGQTPWRCRCWAGSAARG